MYHLLIFLSSYGYFYLVFIFNHLYLIFSFRFRFFFLSFPLSLFVICVVRCSVYGFYGVLWVKCNVYKPSRVVSGFDKASCATGRQRPTELFMVNRVYDPKWYLLWLSDWRSRGWCLDICEARRKERGVESWVGDKCGDLRSLKTSPSSGRSHKVKIWILVTYRLLSLVRPLSATLSDRRRPGKRLLRFLKHHELNLDRDKDPSSHDGRIQKKSRVIRLDDTDFSELNTSWKKKWGTTKLKQIDRESHRHVGVIWYNGKERQK